MMTDDEKRFFHGHRTLSNAPIHTYIQMTVPWCSWNLKPIDPHTATRFSRDCSFEVWSIAAALIVLVYQAALHSLARLSWNLIGCPIYSLLFHVKSIHKKQRTPTLTYFFLIFYYLLYNILLLFFSQHLILITQRSYMNIINVEKLPNNFIEIIIFITVFLSMYF